MVELGFGDVLSLAQTFGIVGTIDLDIVFLKMAIIQLNIQKYISMSCKHKLGMC